MGIIIGFLVENGVNINQDYGGEQAELFLIILKRKYCFLLIVDMEMRQFNFVSQYAEDSLEI